MNIERFSLSLETRQRSSPSADRSAAVRIGEAQVGVAGSALVGDAARTPVGEP